MVTVLSGSESSYVKMTVTFSKANELDAIFAPGGADLTSIFNGYDAAKWIAKGNTKDATANTRTYEFWYKETVGAPTADVALDLRSPADLCPVLLPLMSLWTLCLIPSPFPAPSRMSSLQPSRA